MRIKIKIYLIGFVVTVMCIFLFQYSLDSSPSKREFEKIILLPKRFTVQELTGNKISEYKKSIFKNVILEDIPFFVQAPFANWKDHRESCEEASVLMVHSFQSGKKKMDMQKVDTILREMKKYQHATMGEEKDLYDDELANLIIDFFKYKKVNTYYKASLSDIKAKISQGIPVIVPLTAGKLKNPYYKYSGYHVLVAIGYNDYHQKIITNDPGTKRGEKYSYSYSLFEDARQDVGGTVLTIEDNPMP